jgi:hypothetical protein
MHPHMAVEVPLSIAIPKNLKFMWFIPYIDTTIKPTTSNVTINKKKS